MIWLFHHLGIFALICYGTGLAIGIAAGWKYGYRRGVQHAKDGTVQYEPIARF